jgi:predicted transcriptional regulator
MDFYARIQELLIKLEEIDTRIKKIKHRFFWFRKKKNEVLKALFIERMNVYMEILIIMEYLKSAIGVRDFNTVFAVL